MYFLLPVKGHITWRWSIIIDIAVYVNDTRFIIIIYVLASS